MEIFLWCLWGHVRVSIHMGRIIVFNCNIFYSGNHSTNLAQLDGIEGKRNAHQLFISGNRTVYMFNQQVFINWCYKTREGRETCAVFAKMEEKLEQPKCTACTFPHFYISAFLHFLSTDKESPVCSLTIGK